jgi:hypothetical protein
MKYLLGMGWATVTGVILLLFLLIVGVLVNGISGWYAHKGGEVWGGCIAAIGIAVWVASLWL